MAARSSPVGVAVLLNTALWASAAAAQTTGTDTRTSDNPRFRAEVVVTPERGDTPRDRVAAATVVIDAESLPALPALDLAEIAAFMPGFAVVRPHFHTDGPIVSARGFFGGGEAEYLLLLVDGVPQSDVESGLIDWSVFPAGAVRRVEAVRGPAASLYGDSAIGGVIQLLTDRAGAGGQLTASGGSFATFTADASYGGRLPWAGFIVSGSARRTGGGLEHSAGHQYAATGALDGGTGRLSWRWNLTGDSRTRDTPGASSREAFALDPYGADPLYALDDLHRRRASSSLTIRYDWPVLRPTVRVHASARDEDRVRTIPLAPGLGDRQARALASHSLGGALEGETAYGGTRPLSLRIGADLVREALDTSYRPVGPSSSHGAAAAETSGRRHRTGLFASSAWDVARRVRVSGGLRWDQVQDDEFGGASSGPARHRAWTARGGVAVSLSDNGRLSAFSQVSRAFKAPTLEQLFDPRPYPDFAGGTFTISNRLLMPQRAVNVEAGLSGAGLLRWNAVAYHMDVEDEIDFDLRTFSYGNIGESRHRGLELDAHVTLPRVQPSASYLLTHVTGDARRQLRNVPRHVLAVSADVDLGAAGSVFVRYRHSRGAFLDDDHEYAIDGPSSFDLRLRRTLGRHLLFLDVLNLTRDRYEEYGFTLPDFAGRQVPYVYAGSPRALRAGVTVRY